MEEQENLSDEQLVNLVVQNNKELYALLIKRYQTKLVRYVRYLLGDEAKAQDAVQEAFIKAYVNLKGFDTKKKFGSWLYRIAHNEAMNIVDKHKRTIPLPVDMDFESDVNVEDNFIRQELIDHTRACLDQMDIIYREVLSLYYLEEKSYGEISDILRIPIGTVGTRINRAKTIMKKLCQSKMK